MNADLLQTRGTTLLRAAAVATAVTAIVDPSCTRMREVPLPVEVRSASAEATDRALADRVRQALASSLPERVDVNAPEPPAAIVVAGHVAALEGITGDRPVSVVSQAPPGARNVRVTHVSVPPVTLRGWTGRILATVQGTQVAGRTSAIVLKHGAIELGRVEHTWKSDAETFEASFEVAPPAPGVLALRVEAHAVDGEATAEDNHADLRLAVEDRRLKVLVYEPRPSWSSTFARRVLEAEPLFEVAASTRASRSIEVRAGGAPRRLRPEALEPFDVVLVGAPEELDRNEIDALAWFARVRGGTFILAPDRRPSGAYVRLLPAGSFEERLLQDPATVKASGAALRASEFAIPMKPAAAVEVLAALDAAGRPEPVVISWPAGSGSGVFVGALDAWRDRGNRAGYSAFWRAHVAAAAAGSPRPIDLALDPGVVAPGGTVRLEARVRATEFRSQGEAVDLPLITARLVRADGTAAPIRLWPAAEAGLFEARIEAPEAGRHLVQVSAAGSTFEAPLVVEPGARRARPDTPVSLGLLAASTGGVVAAAGDLSPLLTHFRNQPLPAEERSINPARSPWWMSAFVLLLAAEWAVRRRRGLS